jgi:SAM-dependent methyltransferase
MRFTGERFVPELRGQISYEHLHRYEIARRFARDQDVLDVACGEGYGASYLAQVARSVVGIDSDGDAIRHAASRYTAMNLRFRTGDAAQLPLADGSFDLVVSFETIEHLVEHEGMLSEISRVLRTDGRLIISSPNKLVYSDLPDYQNPFHVRELYFDEFRELLQRHFPSCAIFGHRIFAASAVHPLRGIAGNPGWLGTMDHDGGSGLPVLPAPTYFMAVCGRGAAEVGDLASIYIDPNDDLLARLWDAPLTEAISGSEPALSLTADFSAALPESFANERAKALLAVTATEGEADLADARAALVSADEAREDLRRELAAALDAIAALDARCGELDGALSDARRSSEGLESQIAGARERIEELEMERLAAREAKRRAAEAELERHQLRAEIAERDKEIKRANDVIYDLQRGLLDAGRHLDRQVAEHRALSALFAVRLAEAADALAGERARIDIEIHALSAALSAAQSERIRLASDLNAAESTLAAVLQSRSWRMTSALRRSAAAVRGRPE